MNVLGIETSCDDTSLALFSTRRGIISNLTANQLIHDEYGGVVPEIASRAHIRSVLPVYRALLAETGVDARDIDGIGVANGPGLIGSLLVGAAFAKALAYAVKRPLVGVHHIEAHILSNELEGEVLSTPAVVLVVSGGHTSLYHIPFAGRYELVGNTRDDAAGESFDKIAKLLGLGFPGGPVLEKAARDGDGEAVRFPRAMMKKGDLDFSFSGLKTAVRLYVEGLPRVNGKAVSDVAASAQRAIVDVLVEKTVRCAARYRVGHVYLAGGVAANALLRENLAGACAGRGIQYHAPLLQYCTDNGAMIACAASGPLARGRDDTMRLDVFARGPVSSWA
ncbi:MAG: tRNA (adenosine(37)-N6)-threonylcarbamoyltransferase complex transferase subunit TsaD [Candidatus Krumholzibacteriia bacterium]